MYNDVFQEYITLSHIGFTTPRDIIYNDYCQSFYFPHDVVVKPDKATNKVRVVFNASNTSNSGNSLKDVLSAGPSFQPVLMLLILQWRMSDTYSMGTFKKS